MNSKRWPNWQISEKLIKPEHTPTCIPAIPNASVSLPFGALDWQSLSIRQRLRHPYAINENENHKNLDANMLI